MFFFKGKSLTFAVPKITRYNAYLIKKLTLVTIGKNRALIQIN